MAEIITKRKRGRPAKAQRLQHQGESLMLDQYEDTLSIMPQLFANLKAVAMNPEHRHVLAAIRELMSRADKTLELLQAEEKAEDAASEQASAPSQKDSLASMVSFEWQDDKESQQASKLN